MGLVLMIAGFPFGIFLSWRQTTSASRGLLAASGGIGVFFWLIQLPGIDVSPHSVWMMCGCFLWGFALGNVARYALIKENSSSVRAERSYAEMEDPAKRPRTKPVLPLQAVALVPLYWLACAAWLWLFNRVELQSQNVADATKIQEANDAAVSFGDPTIVAAVWIAAAFCGVVLAWTLRHRKGPPEWHRFFSSLGFSAFNPATIFGLLFCGLILANAPAWYFTRVRLDEERVSWPQRNYIFWKTHEISWSEISEVAFYKNKIGRS
ncbi:MAG: hypothetical protein AB8B50_21170, partial [Pirellulaceae bacterium]